MNDLKTKILVIVAAIAVILAGLFFWQIKRGDKFEGKYLQAKGQAAILETQYTAKVEAGDKKAGALLAQNKALEDERDRLTITINQVEGDNWAIRRENERLKAETAALPADDLVNRINARIGPKQSWAEARGTFTFTRPGVDSTLNRFLDGETATGELKNERAATASLKGVVEATEKQRDNFQALTGDRTSERDVAKQGWDKSKEALTDLEKAIPGLKWKARSQGAAFTAVTWAILKIFKVI